MHGGKSCDTISDNRRHKLPLTGNAEAHLMKKINYLKVAQPMQKSSGKHYIKCDLMLLEKKILSKIYVLWTYFLSTCNITEQTA